MGSYNRSLVPLSTSLVPTTPLDQTELWLTLGRGSLLWKTATETGGTKEEKFVAP